MYFWVVVVALIVWFCLVCGILYLWLKGWRRSFLGWVATVGTLWLVSLAAVLIVLGFGPYWEVVYRTVLQPG